VRGHLQLRTDRDWLTDIVRFVIARRKTLGTAACVDAFRHADLAVAAACHSRPVAGVYAVLQLRRTKYVARFSNVDLLASVAPRRPAGGATSRSRCC